jgi:hypothetical protein
VPQPPFEIRRCGADDALVQLRVLADIDVREL